MLKKQRGMTLISMVIIGSFLASLGLAVLKILPAYMNYASVKSIMDEMPRDEKIKGKSPKYIRSILYRNLDINNLSMIYQDKKAFKFSKIDGGYKLSLKYEFRENLIGNFDYIVVYDYEVDLPVKLNP